MHIPRFVDIVVEASVTKSDEKRRVLWPNLNKKYLVLSNPIKEYEISNYCEISKSTRIIHLGLPINLHDELLIRPVTQLPRLVLWLPSSRAVYCVILHPREHAAHMHIVQPEIVRLDTAML